MPDVRPLCCVSPLALACVLSIAPLAAHAADNTCSLLTNAEIAHVTNDPVLHADGLRDCIWSGQNSRVYITPRDASTWSNGKAAFQKYGHIEQVSGVGDDAFYMGDGPTPTFYALKGAHFIILRVNVKGFSQEQTIAAEKALAAAALGRL